MTDQCLDKWQPKDTYLGSPELPECWQESAGNNPGPSALLGYNINGPLKSKFIPKYQITFYLNLNLKKIMLL